MNNLKQFIHKLSWQESSEYWKTDSSVLKKSKDKCLMETDNQNGVIKTDNLNNPIWQLTNSGMAENLFDVK